MKLGIFLCSLAAWKCLFNSFAYRLFAFILLFFGGALHILHTHICWAHSVHGHFTPSRILLTNRSARNRNGFSSWVSTSGIVFKKSLPSPRLLKIFSCVSFCKLNIFIFHFHPELTVVCGVRLEVKMQCLFCPYWHNCTASFQKTHPFPHCTRLLSFFYIRQLYMYRFVSDPWDCLFLCPCYTVLIIVAFS